MTGEPDPSAAEYALGLLTGSELRAAIERARTDPAFADETARWCGRLAPLHGEVEPVAPLAGMWARIAAAVAPGGAANDNVAWLERRIRVWRTAAAGMSALAASLGVILLWQANAPMSPPASMERRARAPMVAMLSDQQAMKVMVSWDPNARQLVLAVAGDMPADRAHSHELWVIPANGKPRSIGVMPASKQMHMRLAHALATLLQQGATIAISVEPVGGSKTGAPTGPVVAAGALHTA